MSAGRRSRSPTNAENMVITIRKPNTAVGLKCEKISMEKPMLMVSEVWTDVLKESPGSWDAKRRVMAVMIRMAVTGL
ncbi:MAG: hypothetical protein DRI57_11210 [Deltaproteobacteria bacterium]|nr:MAG: hypothetical protein DRI57_11210 [Deltaproteobacteria bacterium]